MDRPRDNEAFFLQPERGSRGGARRKGEKVSEGGKGRSVFVDIQPWRKGAQAPRGKRGPRLPGAGGCDWTIAVAQAGFPGID
jgi:hypothetical protein